jgi:hypothetical protein
MLVAGVALAQWRNFKQITNQVEVLQSVVTPTDNYDATVYDDVILLSGEPAGKQLVLPVRNVPVGKVFFVSNAVGSNSVLLTTADNGQSLQFGAATLDPGIWASVIWTGTNYSYVTENIM